MSHSVKAPQQFRQPSRKGKKAWRKNVDISEVQQGLDDLREDIIQGGPVAEKPSEALFTLDTTGSDSIQKAYNKSHKPLKADEILNRRSAVPGPDSRKRPSTSRITDGIVEPNNKRQKNNWVSKKEVQRLKQVASQNGVGALASARIVEGVDGSTFDLWATPVELDRPAASEYIPKPRAKVAPTTVKEKPISLIANGKIIPAVQNPKAGLSYNPSFDDWEDLLAREGQKAVDDEKERLEAERKAAELQARVDAAAQDNPDAFDDEESEWEGFQSEHENSAYLRKKRPERKTPTERNKAKRRKAAERLARHESRMADKKKQALDIEALNAKGKSKSKDVIPQLSTSTTEEAEADDHTLRRRKFGNIPIPEKPLELVLPEELQDSLRRLKPEGNLLNDRFRNLLVQGKLEARKPVLHPKKKRTKATEKWTYKDFQVGA